MKNNNNFIKKIKKEDKELLKQNKTYEDLLTPLKAIVKEVHYKTSKHYKHSNNGIFGPGYSSTKTFTGQSSKLEIILDEKSPVKKLIFEGYASIQSGDKIIAYIMKGEEKETSPFSGNRKVLIERDWKEEEKTNKIEIKHKYGKDTWEC